MAAHSQEADPAAQNTVSRNILRTLSFGIVLAMSLLAVHAIALGWLTSGFIVTFMLAGTALAFFGWGAGTLWQKTVGLFFHNHASTGAFLSRLPVWFMAGGIAYVLVLLIAERAGVIHVRDTPVHVIFRVGGLIECGAMTILDALPIGRRRPLGTTRISNSGSGT
jgi:hypothetical protein